MKPKLILSDSEAIKDLKCSIKSQSILNNVLEDSYKEIDPYIEELLVYVTAMKAQNKIEELLQGLIFIGISVIRNYSGQKSIQNRMMDKKVEKN